MVDENGTLIMFQKFFVQTKNQFGKRLKRSRKENSEEYVLEESRSFCGQ